MNPQIKPDIDPMEKILHRQVSLLVVDSARAVAPCAAIGAIGKGNRSKSAVTRNKTYEAPNPRITPNNLKIINIRIGQCQSICKRVHSAIAMESGAGAVHQGTLSAISYDSACGVPMK